MTKSEARKYYTHLRSMLSFEQVQHKSYQIASQVLQLPIWQYSFYHLFLSIEEKKEVDTAMILPILQGKDKNVVLSQADFKTYRLNHYLLLEDTIIKKNKWGIPEPLSGISVSDDQIQVVFVPLLAYDKMGNRVGYGKGFYDRFLQKCSSQVIKIGLSFFPPEDSFDNTHSLDIPLNMCVTPENTYFFNF